MSDDLTKAEFCEAMNKLGLTAEEISPRVGCSVPTAARYLSGKSAPVRWLRRKFIEWCAKEDGWKNG